VHIRRQYGIGIGVRKSSSPSAACRGTILPTNLLLLGHRVEHRQRRGKESGTRGQLLGFLVAAGHQEWRRRCPERFIEKTELHHPATPKTFFFSRNGTYRLPRSTSPKSGMKMCSPQGA